VTSGGHQGPGSTCADKHLDEPLHLFRAVYERRNHGRAQVSLPRAKALYIAQAEQREESPFVEVIELFDQMSA
jgi:hypothetical protein